MPSDIFTIDLTSLTTVQTSILTVIAVTMVLYNFGSPLLRLSKRTTESAVLMYRKIDWTSLTSIITPNKTFILMILITLFPTLKNMIVYPPSPPAPPAAELDYLDKCHSSYRKLLGNLYGSVADKDLEDPDVYDDFELRRQSVYKASYTGWNDVVQQHIAEGTLNTLVEQLESNTVVEGN